jgi:hypothetical protein
MMMDLKAASLMAADERAARIATAWPNGYLKPN